MAAKDRFYCSSNYDKDGIKISGKFNVNFRNSAKIILRKDIYLVFAEIGT